MKYYKPVPKIILNFIASMGCAFTFPIYGFITSKFMFVMIKHISPDFIQDRNLCSGIFIGFAFAVGIFEFINKYLNASLCENMTNIVRKKLYASIISKNIGWFDNKSRAPGILSNMIQEDISKIRGLTSQTYANLLEAILCLGIGIAISFNYSWRMAIMALAISPFIIVGGIAD